MASVGRDVCGRALSGTDCGAIVIAGTANGEAPTAAGIRMRRAIEDFLAEDPAGKSANTTCACRMDRTNFGMFSTGAQEQVTPKISSSTSQG